MADEKINDLTGALSLTTDANPMSPRQPKQNNQIHDEQTNTEVQPIESLENIPDPPTDWNLNILLNKIAESLTDEDLGKLKFFFEGEGGIGRGALEKIQNPRDLFRILRTRGYISRDNLLYLQVILYWAGRRDLIEDAVEYSKTVENVLHLYAPSFEPENGYKYVKFHVAGKNFKNYSRSDVESLRKKVHKLLFVPEKFIIIRGIEPSSSLVITFMMPEMYVEILQNLLQEGEDFVNLKENGVDIVEIDGKDIYNIKGTDVDVLVETEQQSKLVNVYEQLQNTKARLDNCEISCIDLAREIGNLQSKIDEKEETLQKVENDLKNLKMVLSTSRDGTEPASLQELSSLNEFTEALNQIGKAKVDKKVVQRMLDSAINIVSTRMRIRHRIQEQTLLLKLQNMQSQLDPLMFELQRHEFFSNISSIDEAVLNGLQLLLQPFIEISLTPYGKQVLAKISSKLRYKEKEKLKHKYQWVPGGEIEIFMEQNQNNFLAGLFRKEVETKGRVHFETFIAQCLSEVGRDDLKKFLEQKPDPNPQSPRYSTDARHKPDLSQNQKSKQQQRNNTKRQDHSQSQQHQQQHQDQSTVITRMADQIQEMYNLLKPEQSMFNSKFGDWKSPTFPFEPQAFQQKQSV